MLDLEKLNRLKEKEYRDAYVDEHVRTRLALQIRALREKAGLTQEQFAKRLGTTQSAVCRMERTDYGKMNVQTLLEIASAMHVALQVRFCPFPEFVSKTGEISDQDLKVETIEETFDAMARAPAVASSGPFISLAPNMERYITIGVGQISSGYSNTGATKTWPTNQGAISSQPSNKAQSTYDLQLTRIPMRTLAASELDPSTFH